METKSKKLYTERLRRRQVRNDVINFNGCKKVVGLAGPQFESCIEFWKSKGANEFVTYENNIDTFIKQMNTLKNVDVNLGDIMNVNYEKDVFYDLDFCCTLDELKGDISKFEDNFMMAFSMRNFTGFKKGDVMDQFFKRRGEIIEGDMETEYCYYKTFQREVVTNKGVYHVTTYRDTCPMITFYKLKNTTETNAFIQ